MSEWVGAPNGRTPFIIHGAVVGFVDRCLLKTRNLSASNYTSAPSKSEADPAPKSAP